MKGIKDFWKQTLIQIAPNFPEKKHLFYTEINVCTFAYVEIILYICNTQEGEKFLLEIN